LCWVVASTERFEVGDRRVWSGDQPDSWVCGRSDHIGVVEVGRRVVVFGDPVGVR